MEQTKKPIQAGANKVLIIFLTFIGLVFAALIVWTVLGNMALEVNRITVASDRLPTAFSGYRIAHVSDLHNAEFGKENEKLLAMLSNSDKV